MQIKINDIVKANNRSGRHVPLYRKLIRVNPGLGQYITAYTNGKQIGKVVSLSSYQNRNIAKILLSTPINQGIFPDRKYAYVFADQVSTLAEATVSTQVLSWYYATPKMTNGNVNVRSSPSSVSLQNKVATAKYATALGKGDGTIVNGFLKLFRVDKTGNIIKNNGKEVVIYVASEFASSTNPIVKSPIVSENFDYNDTAKASNVIKKMESLNEPVVTNQNLSYTENPNTAMNTGLAWFFGTILIILAAAFVVKKLKKRNG